MRSKLRVDNFAGIVMVIILSMIALEFLFIFSVVQNSFEQQQKQELSRYVSFISQSLDESMAVTKDYDALQNANLYEKAKNARNDLEGLAAIDITSEHLEEVKKKHGFTNVAIFVPSDGDVIILNSTNEDEIGMSTKKWSYWHDAFQQLLNNETVDVGRGQYFQDFWVGPKTKSHTLKGFYKFGYIHNPKEKYIINVYVQSDEMIADRAAGSVNKTLDDIRDNIDYVDHIGIVKADILKAYRNTEYEGSNKEPLILYGDIKNTGFTKIDYDVDDLMASGEMLFEDLDRNNQRLVLKKLNENEMLVIIINNLKMDELLQKFMLITIALTVVASAAILVVNFWMIRKYGALLDVQRDRLDLAKSFKKTIQSMPSMIFHCKKNEYGDIVLTYNDGMAFTADEVVLTDSDHVKLEAVYSSDFVDKAKKHLIKAFNNGKSRFEASHNGRIFDVLVSPVVESGVDAEGQVIEVIGFGTDISERLTRQRSAEYLAMHDQLTSLPNRRAFAERIEEHMTAGKEMFIVYFDLDQFKKVNDAYGHQVGDEVLQQIAERFKLFTNDAFKIARMGGDEFVASCYDLSQDEVEVLTQRIIDTISKPIELDDVTCTIGASAGISHYPRDGKSTEILIAKADKAMYESKAKGGNSYKVAD